MNVGVRISRHEIIDGQSLARLDTINAGASEQLTQTDKGVYRHSTNGIRAKPPVQILPYPPTIGAKWQDEFTTDLVPGKNMVFGEIQQEEVVEVPAGKFKALRVALRVESQGVQVHSTYWFVKDIGFVKQSINLPGANVLMELERYELKNPPPRP